MWRRERRLQWLYLHAHTHTHTHTHTCTHNYVQSNLNHSEPLIYLLYFFVVGFRNECVCVCGRAGGTCGNRCMTSRKSLTSSCAMSPSNMPPRPQSEGGISGCETQHLVRDSGVAHIIPHPPPITYRKRHSGTNRTTCSRGQPARTAMRLCRTCRRQCRMRLRRGLVYWFWRRSVCPQRARSCRNAQ